MEKTFSIIKPDGVRRNLIGQVLAKIEQAGLRITATKLVHMTKEQAEKFYEIHAKRPFYQELCEYMISGPVLVSVLEGPNAVAVYRDIMGATNPAQAEKGTIRAEFALSIGENTVHGSDSSENAKIEISHFFSEIEMVNSLTKISH